MDAGNVNYIDGAFEQQSRGGNRTLVRRVGQGTEAQRLFIDSDKAATTGLTAHAHR